MHESSRGQWELPCGLPPVEVGQKVILPSAHLWQLYEWESAALKLAGKSDREMEAGRWWWGCLSCNAAGLNRLTLNHAYWRSLLLVVLLLRKRASAVSDHFLWERDIWCFCTTAFNYKYACRVPWKQIGLPAEGIAAIHPAAGAAGNREALTARHVCATCQQPPHSQLSIGLQRIMGGNTDSTLPPATRACHEES